MNIEEQIAKLKEQARGRGIVDMGVKVAEGLGKGQHNGAWCTKAELYIAFDNNGGNLSVSWNGTTVLTTHLDDIIAYRPDIEDWEAEIERLYYERVVPSQNAAAMNAQDIKARWGIEAEA